MVNIEELKIDINKIPEENINSMVRGLLESMKNFYSKRENVEAYEKWKEKEKSA